MLWGLYPIYRLKQSSDSYLGRAARRREIKLPGELRLNLTYNMKRKLTRLLKTYHIRLVHPIAQEKWIIRQTAKGDPVSRRKSPKRGRVIDLFGQLVYLPDLLSHPNLDLEVLLGSCCG